MKKEDKASLFLLLALTVLRLAVAATAPLSADEAYYRIWALAPAAGYPDHPPGVALLIRAGMALAGDNTLGVRLLAPVAALLGSLFLMSAGRDLADARAGRRAALLLNATLLLNAGAVIITPDTPLLLFWTAALAALARAWARRNPDWLLAAGLAAGMAIDSKYTAFLLAPSAALWLIANPGPRAWLRGWHPYVATALALAIFAPVFAWNAAHRWASFARQGGRAADWAPAHALRYLAELLAGQIGLATPLLFLVLCGGVAACARRGGWKDPARNLPLCLTGVPLAVLLQHALGDRVQANWPAVLYPGAALATGMAWCGPWRLPALSGVVLSALLFLQAAAAPLALPRRLDFTLIRLGGWRHLAGDVARARASDGGGFVAADEYGLASELAFRLNGPVLGVEPRWALFDLKRPDPAIAPRGGILIRSTRRAGPPSPADWPGARFAGTLTRSRNGVVAETYTVWRVGPPAPATPARQLPAAR